MYNLPITTLQPILQRNGSQFFKIKIQNDEINNFTKESDNNLLILCLIFLSTIILVIFLNF